MRAFLLFLMAVLLAEPATAEPVRVTVSQSHDGFFAEYTLPADAPAWGFWRSSTAASDNQPWRARSWRVATPGVTLQRRGQQEAFVGMNGRSVPRKLRVQLNPFTGDLNGDYVPALVLGVGTVALFDGHFALYSVDQVATLDKLPSGFDPALVGDPGTAVKFEAPRHLRIAGDVDGYRAGNSSGAYGIFGLLPTVIGDGVDTMIDSELPRWIADYISIFTPTVISALTERLGPSGLTAPIILASWEGPGREGASMNGGTLKGLILMRFEGKAALTEIPALKNMARWFIAHEASHFWLGQAVRYESARDSWIMEGGADLLAVRTVSRLDPAFDGRKVLNDALRDCSALAVKPVATAIERGEHRAYYACGAVFALVAEKANRGDFFGFTRSLIESNRTKGEVSGGIWLAALDRASGKPALSGTMRELIDQGSSDPKAVLAGLLKGADIAFKLDAQGVPQL